MHLVLYGLLLSPPPDWDSYEKSDIRAVEALTLYYEAIV